MTHRIPHSSPLVSAVERRRVEEVVASNFVGHGRVAAALEARFRERTGRKHAFAVQSGFHALSLALRAFDLAPGAAVALPVLTCASVLEAVLGAGQQPQLVDVDRARLTLDAASVTIPVDALVVPHAYGAPADAAAARALNVPWIEDCATSPATTVDGRPAGSWGTFSVFSFGSTKYLTGGGGGMVLTDEDALASRVRDLLDFEQRDRARWTRAMPAALPGRLPDLNAALALAQHERLEEFLGRRRSIAAAYRRALAGVVGVVLPPELPGHSYFRYLCRTERASGPVAAALSAAGIDARDAVNPWLDELARARGLNVGRSMPAAHWWRGHLLSLPIHPGMTEADVERVATTAAEVLAGSPARVARS